MAGNLNLFCELRRLNKEVHVKLPDGNLKSVKNIGSIQLTPKIKLENVLYLPQFQHNLMSLSKVIHSNNLKVVFDKTGCYFQDLSTNEKVVRVREHEGVYVFEDGQEHKGSSGGTRINKNQAIFCNVKSEDLSHVCNKAVSIDTIHARLGHGSLSKLKHLSFCQCENVDEFYCDTCSLAKHHRLPLPPSRRMAKNVFDLLHVDLWGPYKVPNVTGEKYFLTILDDHSRVTWTQLLRSKDQVRDTVAKFLAYVENQFKKKVRMIISDNGTEIVKEECQTIFANRGIVHQRSVVGVPQQNGRVERKHRYLIDTARALRIHAGLPKFLWGECVLAATHLINLLPSAVIRWDTPYERLIESKPSYDHLRVIGCLCYASGGLKKGDKFEEEGIRSVLIGYPYAQKGYKLYDLKKGKVFVSRDVIFKEKIFPYLQSERNEDKLKERFNEISLTDQEILIPTIATEEDQHESEGREEYEACENGRNETSDYGAQEEMAGRTSEQSRPVRNRQVSSRLKGYVYELPGQDNDRNNTSSPGCEAENDADVTTSSSEYVASFNNVMKVYEPIHYNQAIGNENWERAMQEELDALEKNETWEFTTLPEGKKALDSKWVYKVKYKQDGNVERYKARLVARGDKQIKNKDYKHTFSPVAMFTTVRVLLAIASMMNWKLYQLDINNAFLHGKLEEEVYLKPTQGYSRVPRGQVCKLKKSLYGLKQASRQWNIELKEFLIKRGFKQCPRDYSLFTKTREGRRCIILAYVDDLLNTGDDVDCIMTLKQELDQEFTIKDLGEMRYFLGIEVYRDSKGILINQKKVHLGSFGSHGATACYIRCMPVSKARNIKQG
ncbi:Retrovirus-related Pol polyprotein from transposon TNT 1-94 [Bienertia sinuspersici]